MANRNGIELPVSTSEGKSNSTPSGFNLKDFNANSEYASFLFWANNTLAQVNEKAPMDHFKNRLFTIPFFEAKYFNGSNPYQRVCNTSTTFFICSTDNIVLGTTGCSIPLRLPYGGINVPEDICLASVTHCNKISRE